MRGPLIVIGCLVATAALPLSVAAQTCRGTAAIGDASPWQVGGGLAFTEGFTQYDVNGVAGSDVWIAGGQVGRFDFDELDQGATFVAGHFGVQVPNDASRRVVLCPSVSVGNVFGPNDVGGVDVSIFIVTAAANVGFIAAQTGRMQFVPTAGVSVSRQRLAVDVDGESESDSETIGVLEAGMGIVLDRRFTILPSVDVPFGVEDADVGFRIALTVNFGR